MGRSMESEWADRALPDELDAGFRNVFEFPQPTSSRRQLAFGERTLR